MVWPGWPPAGRQRVANRGRQIREGWIACYLERWDLLDQSAWATPFLGDPELLELAREVPLPTHYRPLVA